MEITTQTRLVQTDHFMVMNEHTVSQAYFEVPWYVIVVPCILIGMYLFRRQIWKSEKGRNDNYFKLVFGITFCIIGTTSLILNQGALFTLRIFAADRAINDAMFWEEKLGQTGLGFIVLGVVQLLRFQRGRD